MSALSNPATRQTSTRHGRRPASPRVTAFAVAAVVLAACGGATPTVAPTAAPTPTPTAVPPSPTPFDVGAAFLAIVGDPAFTAKIALDGEIEMGLTVKMAGTMEGSGDDSRQSMSVTYGSVTTTTETVRVGQQSWTRTLPGPWLVTTGGSSSGGIGKWLGGLATLDDLGVVTKDGVSLHHLRPAAGSKVPADVLGLDPAQFTNPDITMELYAKDDGTPALFEMRGSWVQQVNGQDINVELAIDMTVSNVGVPITVTAPTDVWVPYTSANGYSVAHPADFTVVPDPDGDTYQLDGVDWFYVTPYTAGKGLSLEGWRDAVLEGYATSPGPPRATPVKTSLRAGPAYVMTFELEADDGTDLVLVDVVLVNGDLGWEIALVTTPAAETTDLALFDMFLATLKFTK